MSIAAPESDNHERRFALLFGCPLGLQGTEQDLKVMQQLLQRYRFDCDLIFKAKRLDILKAWRDIIDNVSAKDAVLIYYSGHGGMVEDKSNSNHRRLKYIVPYDFEEMTGDDWRGISDLEISQLLRQTTEKTKNTTLILDCCVASRMARYPGTVKTLNPHDYEHIFRHIQTLMAKRNKALDSSFDIERNPDAIVLAASAETDSAYESIFNGLKMSVLVEAFEYTLGQDMQRANSAPISWRSIMLRMRERMKITCPLQFPQIEGDDLRFAFSLQKANIHGALAVSPEGGGVTLGGGEVHGLKKGDTFALVPLQEESFRDKSEIAEVVVEAVGPTKSFACFEGESHLTEQCWEKGVTAFPKNRCLNKLPVMLKGEHIWTRLKDSIQDSSFVTVAEKGILSPLATVHQEDGDVRLYAHEGQFRYILRSWNLSDTLLANEAISLLESLARARHILTLQTAYGKTDGLQFNVEVGKIKDSSQVPLLQEGTTIKEGEAIFIKVSNIGPHRIYVSIFDVCGPSAKLLSQSAPYGRGIDSQDAYMFGHQDYLGRLVGSEVRWPDKVPDDSGEILETIIIIAMTGPVDLRGLSTGPREARGPYRNPELARLLDNISTSGARDIKPDSQDYVQFAVRRFSFFLSPLVRNNTSVLLGEPQADHL